jgi:two-component system response regulator HydG
MKSLQILVVDDNQDFAEGLADALELEGHHVEIASNGREALETFTEFEFDLTFMDIMLPGPNGIESFAQIRRRFPGAKVILMTAYSLDHLLEGSDDPGVVGAFHKPLALDEVMALLDRIRRRPRILVASGDVDLARELRDVLEMADYSVRSCFDGESTLLRCAEETFSSVVLDPLMPDLTGLDIYHALRAAHPELPVIPVAGDPGLAARTFVASDFEVTPETARAINPNQLLRTLKAHLEEMEKG